MVKWKTNELKEYAKTLIKNGFKIYTHNPKNVITWLIFEKNNNIGYVQNSYFGGLDFSTKHKANRRTGTGFQTAKEVINPTIENALNTFIKYPYWCEEFEKESVIKYKDIKEFLKENNILKYVQIKEVI